MKAFTALFSSASSKMFLALKVVRRLQQVQSITSKNLTHQEGTEMCKKTQVRMNVMANAQARRTEREINHPYVPGKKNEYS